MSKFYIARADEIEKTMMRTDLQWQNFWQEATMAVFIIIRDF